MYRSPWICALTLVLAAAGFSLFFQSARADMSAQSLSDVWDLVDIPAVEVVILVLVRGGASLACWQIGRIVCVSTSAVHQAGFYIDSDWYKHNTILMAPHMGSHTFLQCFVVLRSFHVRSYKYTDR